MRLPSFAEGAAAVQLLGAISLAAYLVTAFLSLASGRGLRRVRLLVAEGVVTSLGFMVPATILKTLSLRTWDMIAVFTVILGLRILLKRHFAWERARLVGSPGD